MKNTTKSVVIRNGFVSPRWTSRLSCSSLYNTHAHAKYQNQSLVFEFKLEIRWLPQLIGCDANMPETVTMVFSGASRRGDQALASRRRRAGAWPTCTCMHVRSIYAWSWTWTHVDSCAWNVHVWSAEGFSESWSTGQLDCSSSCSWSEVALRLLWQ